MWFPGIGEFEVIVHNMEVSLVNSYQLAPNIISLTWKLNWGQRPKCNLKSLILKFFDIFYSISWYWCKKYINLLLIPFRPIYWAPEWSKSPKNDKIMFFPGSLHWIHTDSPNWEFFANYFTRNFLTSFLDFWQNSEWNFSATLILMLKEGFNEGVTVLGPHPVRSRVRSWMIILDLIPCM